MSYRLESTRFSNLARDGESGTYFCRAKIKGKKLCKSLKTKSVEIAKIRLAKLLEGERERLARLAVEAPAAGGDTFKLVADAWLAEVEADPALKTSSKKYRRETLQAIRGTWPELDAIKLHAVTEAQCRDWAARVKKRYAFSRFNGCVETLRAIFKAAVMRGYAATNPAMCVERMPVVAKPRTLPPAEKLRELLAALDAVPERRRAALSVRFLVYGGARPTASSQVMPKDVDLAKNEITFPPIKHQSKPLTVPMSKELRAVVEKLLADHPGGDLPLSPIADPSKALAAACKDVGIPRLTRYDLRHLFTTHLLESGVPVPTVAALRGDKDGGAMLLKTYFHARSAHLHEAVKAVKW